MKFFNSNGRVSKRFWLTLIGLVLVIGAAVLKHFLAGLSTELVITAAGLVTAYNAAESWRPSGQNGANGKTTPAVDPKIEPQG